MVERRAIRKERSEAQLFGPELLNVWEGESTSAEQKLNSSSSLNSLVDVIRTSGLRAKIARERDKEFPDLYFNEWQRSWNSLKYRALVETIKRRDRGDKKILIAYSIDDQQPERYQERLTFVFLTEPKPYRTSTALSNLTRITPKEDLMASLGESDQLPELPKARRFEV